MADVSAVWWTGLASLGYASCAPGRLLAPAYPGPGAETRAHGSRFVPRAVADQGAGNAAHADLLNEQATVTAMGDCPGAEVSVVEGVPRVSVGGQRIDPKATLGIGDSSVNVALNHLSAYFELVQAGAQAFVNKTTLETVTPGEAALEVAWGAALEGVADATSGAVAAPFAAALPVGGGVAKGLAKTAFKAAAAEVLAAAPRPAWKDPKQRDRQRLGESLHVAAVKGSVKLKNEIETCVRPTLASSPIGPALASEFAAQVKAAVDPMKSEVNLQTDALLEGQWHRASREAERANAWFPGLVPGGPARVEAFWSPGLEPVVQRSEVPGADAGLLESLEASTWLSAGLDMEVTFSNLGFRVEVRGGRVVACAGTPDAEQLFAAEVEAGAWESLHARAVRGAASVVARLKGRGWGHEERDGVGR